MNLALVHHATTLLQPSATFLLYFTSACKILHEILHSCKKQNAPISVEIHLKMKKITLFQLRQPPFLSVLRNGGCLPCWSVGGSEKIQFVDDEMSMQTCKQTVTGLQMD